MTDTGTIVQTPDANSSAMTISEMLSHQGVRAAEIDLDDGGETTEHHDDVLGGEAASVPDHALPGDCQEACQAVQVNASAFSAL